MSGIEQKCFQTAYKIEDLNNCTSQGISGAVKKQQQQTTKTKTTAIILVVQKLQNNITRYYLAGI